LLVAGCWLLVNGHLTGQTLNDFRTTGNVTFAAATNWQRYDGTSWVAAGAAPTQAANIITIRNTHTAFVTASIPLNQLVVEAGGILTINAGITLTLRNGPGTDLNVSGTVNNSWSLSINSGATIVFNANSTYNHARNGGTIPAATWSLSSNCNITGVTATVPNGFGQQFGNITWASPGQTGICSLYNLANSGSVAGNFSVMSTGTSFIRISNTSSPTLSIAGDLNISGGEFRQLIGNGSPTINIGGNLNISSGIFNMVSSTGTATIHLNGDFVMTGGTLTETGSGTARINFINTSAVQNIRSSVDAISNTINFNVNSNVIVDFGVSDYLNGTGRFTLSDGATLQTAHPSGVNGSVQTSLRTLSASANYTFNGTSVQSTGSFLPDMVNNLSIENPAVVNLTNGVTVNNLLTMASGNINTGSNILVLAPISFSSLDHLSGTIIGRFRRGVQNTGEEYLFPVGTSTDYRPAIFNFSSLSSETTITAQFIVATPGSFATYADDGTNQLDYAFTDGYWNFSSASTPGSTYSLSLTGEGFASNIIDDNSRISGRNAGITDWNDYGTHGTVNVGSSTITRTDLTTLNTSSFDYCFAGRCSINATAGEDAEICEGGSVTLNGSGGGTYLWSPSTGLSNVNIPDPVASPAATTEYTLTVTQGSCISTDQVTITVHPLPSPVVTGDNVVCPGASGVRYSTPELAGREYEWTVTGATSYSGENSSEVTVNWASVCNGTGTVRVTETITASGCSAVSADFPVFIIDNEGPVWDTPENDLDQTVECSDAGSLTAAQSLFPLAADNCDTDVTNILKNPGVFVPDPLCPQSGSYTNIWTVTDECGNTSVAYTQVITVKDNTAPTWVTAAGSLNRTVSCSDAGALAAAQSLVPEAVDNCDPGAGVITKVAGEFVTPDNPDEGTYTNIFTITDNCGNVSEEFVQVITVTDNVHPVIYCPSDITVSCDGDTSPPGTGLATATDNCTPDGDIVIASNDVNTYSSDPSEINHYNYVITRTWIATDRHGNFSGCIQKITVQDGTGPIIIPPPDITVNCHDNPITALTGTATASDNCSPETFIAIDHTDTDDQDPDPAGAGHYNYLITRTWRATDKAGNVSQSVQFITVEDVTSPVITCPEDVSVSCEESTEPGNTGTATATDNCTPQDKMTITHLDSSDQDPSPASPDHYNYTITRTWRATDPSVNHSECTQTITVKDVTAPSFTVPASATVCREADCSYDIDPAITGGITGESDNCTEASLLTVSWDDDPVEWTDCNAAGLITRTWSLTDISGNISTQVQAIWIEPTPTATIQNNSPVICDSSAVSIIFDSPTVSTNPAGLSFEIVVTSSDPSSLGGTASTGFTIAKAQMPYTLDGTLINTSDEPLEVTYSVNAVLAGCSDWIPVSETVIINPTPKIFPVANTIQCDSTTTSIVLQSPSTFTDGQISFKYTVTATGGVTGFATPLADLPNNHIIADQLVNPTDEPQTVTYVITPVSPVGCNDGPSQTVEVVVNPTPKIFPVLEDLVQCDSTTTSIRLQSPGTFTSGDVKFEFTATAPAGLSGYTPGATGLDNGYVIEDNLINTTDGPLSVTYRVVPLSPGTCNNGPAQVFTVTVNPTPRIFPVPLSPTVQCDSTATGILLQSPSTFTDGDISFRYTVTATGGVTGFFTPVADLQNNHIIADQLVNPTDEPQTVTYVITPVSPLGCNDGPSQTVEVVVNPTPRIFPVLEDLVQCDSTTTSITLQSPGTFTSGDVKFDFTATAPAGLSGYTPTATGLDNGYVIEDYLINTTDGPLSVTYRVVPVSPGTCNNGPAQTFKVTVNPTPRIFPVPLSTTVQCDSTATGILLQSPSTFTDGQISFKYTVTETGGVTGFTTPVSGVPNNHIIADQLVNPTDEPQTVTYVITPVSPPGCNDGPSQSVEVVVNPTPRIFPVLEDMVQCDSITTSITVLSPSIFSTGQIRFNYTATAPAGLTGYTPLAEGLHNGDIIEDKLINLTDVPLAVTYRVVPISPLGCNAGPAQVFTVTVNPTPRIFPVPPDIIQCDSAITSILLRSPSTFTTGLIAFRYTVTATGNVTGFTTPVSGLSNNHVIDDRLVNPTDEPQSVTYTIYPVSPLGCNEGPRQIITVRINPTPRFYVTAVADTLCNNETSLFTVTTPTTLTAGNVYFSYTIAETSGDLTVISGYTTASGVIIPGAGPVTFTQTLVNHSDAVQWVRYRLHPFARNTGGGDCDHGSARDTVITLLVEPTAKVNGTISSDTICNNSPITYTLETPTTAIYGVRFNVRVLNPWPEITGADDRDDLPDLGIINETLNNDGDTARMIMYVVTPATLTRTGMQKCIGINDTIRLWINPTPRVIPVNAFPAICYGDLTSIALTSPSVMTKGEIRFDFSVTASGAPGDITGHFDPGTDIMPGEILAYRYRNYYDSVLSVLFAITPKAPGLTCATGNIDIQEVQVHPKPNRGIQILKPLTCDVGSGLATIRAVISRGADPYHLVWDGPVGYHSEDSIEIHNLYGGQYTLRVSDNLGCTGDTVINVIPLTARPQLFAFPILSDIHVSCTGGSDGTIRVYVSSGITAPYRYWVVRNLTDTLYTGILMNNYNPVDPTTYRIYTGLPAGDYLLIIRDIHDCEVTRPAELMEPDPIEVRFGMSDFNGYNVPCRGYSNGSAWVESITGGTGSYIYEWFPEIGTLSVSTNEPLLDSIPAGKYYLRITDLLGCVYMDSVTLIEPDGMQLTGSELSVSPDGNYNISCNGISDGYIKLSITGGSGNFTYSWAGPDGYTSSARDISGLRAGTYTSTITDMNGCMLLIPPTDSLPSFVLTEPDAINIDILTSISVDGDYNIDCYGGIGTIDITVTGGSEGTYFYNWSTYDGSGIVDGADDQLNLTAGTYYLVVSDLNGCFEERYITLTQPNILIPNLQPTHITCESTGFDNGSIHLTVIGGIGPYSILWSTGETTEDISGLTEGNYTVTITDMSGCQIIDSVRIELPPPLTYHKIMSDYNGFNISCYGRSDGSIQVMATSGLAPYSYTWQGPEGFVAYTPEIFGLKAGSYILYIRDDNICEAADTIVLTEPGRLDLILNRSVSTAGGYNINCAGSPTGSVAVTAVNNAGPVQYIWSDGTIGSVRDNLTAGNYKVIITDANNCHADSAFVMTQPDSVKLSFEVTPAFCPDMPDGAIALTVTGGVALSDYRYLWSDNSTGNGLDGLTKGLYGVTVTDDNGCSAEASVRVESLNPICLVIPNGISPNNDGINDVWNIGLTDLYPQIEVSIFNRWGELIWKSEKGYPKPWDGRSRGSVLPIDSYHYIIDLNDGSRQIIGNITIVK